MSVLIKDMEKPKYCYAVIDGEVNQMKTNYLEKRTPQERLIIAKTLLETVLDDMPSAEKAQLSGEDATKDASSDLISRKKTLDVIRTLQTYKLFEGDDMILVDKADVQTELMMLPSAEPETKPISYMECANAMLKMWIDNVLTDGEYNRIMDKLNSKHMADIRGEQE